MLTEIFEIALQIIGYTLTGYCVYKILYQFAKLRSENVVFRLIIILLLGMGGNMIIYTDELTGTIGSLLTLAVVIMLGFVGEVLVKTSMLLIIYPIAISLTFVTNDLGYHLWRSEYFDKDSMLLQSLLNLLVITVRILMWFILYGVVKNWLANMTKVFTTKMWLLIDAMSCTSSISIIIVIANTDMNKGYIAYPVAAATVLTSIGCCYLCAYISKSHKIYAEAQALKYQENYYKEVEDNQAQIRKLKHDMKNHLSIIGHFLNENNYDKAKTYFEDLQKEFNNTTYVFCENSTVNAILNIKHAEALEHNISSTIQFDTRGTLPINEIDLCTIIANTMDNAIEAGMKVEESAHRHLSLRGRIMDGHLMYEIVNTKCNEVRKHKERFLTDKKDKEFHGIGLRAIQELVQKYGGTIEIKDRKDEFEVVIFV